MRSMRQVVTIPLVLLLMGATTPAAPRASEEDRVKQLEKERQRLERETDLVDRTKIGIKISELLLEGVGESLEKENVAEMEQRLTQYADTIQQAHQSLVDSGRNAVKKPNGFKELEIALRKHTRKLEDFARMLNLQQRVPLEKVKNFARGIQEKLLKALFP
jgi:hypothetical protein